MLSHAVSPAASRHHARAGLGRRLVADRRMACVVADIGVLQAVVAYVVILTKPG
jgi:hypothetical protein